MSVSEDVLVKACRDTAKKMIFAVARKILKLLPMGIFVSKTALTHY